MRNKMSKTKQALELAVAALREAREDVEEVAHNCAAALAGTEKGARRVEAYRQQLAEIDTAIRDAEAALAKPKPEPEPVAWQHRRPRCGNDGYEIGYGDWEDGYGLEQWPHRALYAGAAPTQSAELAAATAERDQLRAEVERLRAERVPLTIGQIEIATAYPRTHSLWRHIEYSARRTEEAHGIT